MKKNIKKSDVKFIIEIFNEKGIKNKNSPSYIIKNNIIKIKLILYCILILVKDLKPHS
jgi:hypothetical protein